MFLAELNIEAYMPLEAPGSSAQESDTHQRFSS